ncbi:Decarboxylase, pyridoxal-dependent (plasmid) [Streptomyces clavuligerus]|uniref:Decarboxylase, pyridoxal-dependent n=2 Tax=Streptomyces clavuligerus TaxID=1901 RepID=D5SKP7_STRCL|nr:Decarboxylase, pyridoxal-dependent [Streptomyces clavuligerus]
MRTLGYRVVDAIVEHLTGPGGGPVADRAAGDWAERLLTEPLPVAAHDPERLLEEALGLLRRGNAHPDHPRFLAFVPSPGTYAGVLASALATGFAVPTGWRLTGPVSSAVEVTAIRWLARLMGLPEGTGGLLVPGGSTANLTALTVARDEILGEEGIGEGTAYCSDQTHFSVPRALRLLGVGPRRVRCLPTGGSSRLDAVALAARVAADRRAGLRPFAVIANAGTVSTGAIDPLPELAALCRAEGLWLHVDGAFGAAAALTEEGRSLLGGLDLADSLTVDPHKWLFQPAELGCVLLRSPALLRRTFGISLPPFLGPSGEHPDAETGTETETGTGTGTGGGVDFLHFGIQQTREFKALRLWLSLKMFGSDAFVQAVGRGLANARELGRFIAAQPGVELVTPPSLAVLTFRCVPPDGYEVPESCVDLAASDLANDGGAMVMPTTATGRRAFRICTVNPRTSPADLRDVVIRLRDLWRARAREAARKHSGGRA